MSDPGKASVHASAVLVGDRAVLIRGPSGSGKSRLAFDLILAGRAGVIQAAALVGDDRVTLEAQQNRLVVRPASALAGLIEIRGLGIRRCDSASDEKVASRAGWSRTWLRLVAPIACVFANVVAIRSSVRTFCISCSASLNRNLGSTPACSRFTCT